MYYTKNSKGEYKEPRVLIVLNGKNDIFYISGLKLGQSVEDCMIPIVKGKIMSFSGNEKYKKIVNDITLLIKLEYKVNHNIELTKKELIFLYVLNSKIMTGFGLEDDCRIVGIKSKKNVKKDLAYVFMCKEENIATKVTDFDKNKIIYYYGKLNWKKEVVPRSFKTLKRIIGNANFSNLTKPAGLNNL